MLFDYSACGGTPIYTITQSEQLWFTEGSCQMYSQPINTVPPNSFPPTLSSCYSGWGCMVSGCCSARYMYCQHASHCNTLVIAKDWDKDVPHGYALPRQGHMWIYSNQDLVRSSTKCSHYHHQPRLTHLHLYTM